MKLRKGLIKMTVVAVLSLFIVSGCGGIAEKNGNSGAQEQKTITVGMAQSPTNLDPAEEYNGWYVVKFGLGETLVKMGKNMKIEPWLAESWTKVDDLTWKIKVRDNVVFQNGKKVSGEAVKASLERSIKVNKRAPQLLDIASIKAEGNDVMVKNNHPNPSFIPALADPFAVIADAEAAGTMSSKPVLTGPFKVKEYVKDVQVVVGKNDTYWGDKAKLDKVAFKFIPDGNTRMMALQAGEIQVADNVPVESMEIIKKSGTFEVLSESSLRTHMLILNTRKPGLDDVKVRKAISLAINREDLGNKVMEGGGIPAIGPFPSALPFGSNELSGYACQPEEAKKLLDNAGWKNGPDNIRQKNGKKLEFTVLCYKNRPELPVLLETIQGELRTIGIKINIANVEKISEALKGDYDASIYSLNTAPTGDPQYLLETMFRTGASSNYANYSSPRLDALADKLKTTFDSEERNALAKEAQQVVLDDAAYACLVYPKTNMAVNNKVSGIVLSPSEYYMLNSKAAIMP